MLVQRQPAVEAPATPSVTDEQVDQIVGTTITAELERYRNIPVTIQPPPLPEGFIGPPRPPVTVHIQSVYFINTATARAHYATAREESDFRAITRALRDREEWSLIEGGTGPRGAGRAVELGKATPDDVRLFIEEAGNRGVIRNYARRERVLDADQELIDLEPDALRGVIQDWTRHTGVGVDCSGLLVDVTIRARENVRQAMIDAGVPQDQIPDEMSHVERGAASYRGGPRVATPADLRPGDAWVVRDGGHIRVVTNVREVTLPDDTTAIEFETAESAGGSTQSSPGPVGRTWRTRSTARFNPITRVGHTGGAVGGSFHRIP